VELGTVHKSYKLKHKILLKANRVRAMIFMLIKFV